MRKDGLIQSGKFWDLTGRVPVAKEAIRCPSCQSEDTMPRQYRFTLRPNSPSKYRCNVLMKCQHCSLAWPLERFTHSWVHGVVIPEEMFNLHVPQGDTAVLLDWRDAEGIK